MKIVSKIGVYEKLLILFIIGAFILRVLLINQDISVLLSKFLSDDTYYAYSLAQNILEGEGIVFNDGVPTNGFHPFYNFVILVPLFKIFYNFGINVPIYASLFVLAIFNIGTSVFLYLIVSKILNKKAGLLAAFIWLFNPYILFVSLIGLETSVQVFFIALLIYLLVNKWNRIQFSIKESIVIGLLVGLIFLSRMDGIFIGIGVVVAISLRKLFQNKKFSGINLLNLVRQTDLIAIIIVAFLVVLPWLLWSFIEVGRITPISGEAVHLLAASNLSDKSYVGLVKHAIYSTFGFVAKFFLYITDDIMQGLILVSLVLIIPTIILIIKRDKFLTKALVTLDFLVISSLFYYTFYWFYQLGIREWYSMFNNFLLTIVFSMLLIRISQIFEPNRIGKFISGILFCGLIAFFVIGGMFHYQRGNFPQEKLKWEVANFINDNISPNEIVGSFNTGIYQYYTAYHDVINLDGVMNLESLKAMKSNSIETYILTKNISYIVDRPYYAQQVNQSILSLEPVKMFEMHYSSYKLGEGVETIVIFRVVPNIL